MKGGGLLVQLIVKEWFVLIAVRAVEGGLADCEGGFRFRVSESGLRDYGLESRLQGLGSGSRGSAWIQRCLESGWAQAQNNTLNPS